MLPFLYWRLFRGSLPGRETAIMSEYLHVIHTFVVLPSLVLPHLNLTERRSGHFGKVEDILVLWELPPFLNCKVFLFVFFQWIEQEKSTPSYFKIEVWQPIAPSCLFSHSFWLFVDCMPGDMKEDRWEHTVLLTAQWQFPIFLFRSIWFHCG